MSTGDEMSDCNINECESQDDFGDDMKMRKSCSDLQKSLQSLSPFKIRTCSRAVSVIYLINQLINLFT